MHLQSLEAKIPNSYNENKSLTDALLVLDAMSQRTSRDQSCWISRKNTII